MCHHWLVLEEMSTSCVLMLGKDPWELVPRFPKTLPRVPLPFADLASYSFAVINLSPEYNCLLNTVSPPNKPPHLGPLTQLPRPRTSFLPSLVQLAKPVMICPYYDLSRYFYWSPMCAHYLSDRHGWGRDGNLKKFSAWVEGPAFCSSFPLFCSFPFISEQCTASPGLYILTYKMWIKLQVHIMSRCEASVFCTYNFSLISSE